ncbi:hypothetical protein F4811DRAFT_570343 [Daldinia bambusicola]|nr:hypothetical protein F4811DRAFT_570343 [Daldinia bambusicola]
MDPLSISAGVAGFISLGLTAAGGIIQYCKSYRSLDSDLAQLMHHAEELESFLSLIRDRSTAPQSLPGDIDTCLQGCRDACDTCLKDVKLLNAKYTHPRPRWKPSKRLNYPFDKAKLDDLRSRLQEFHARLLGFLQLATLDATRDIRSIASSESAKIILSVKTVGREVQSSISNVQQEVTSTIQSSTSQLQSSFRRSLGETEVHLMSSLDGNRHQLESSFQRDLAETETHLMSSLENNHSALSNQVSLVNVTQENQFLLFRQFMDRRLGILEKNQQELVTRALSASAVADDPNEVSNSSNADCRFVRRSVREKMNLGMSEQSIFNSLCTCSKMQKRRSTKQHQDGCIFSLKQYDSWTFKSSFRVLRRVITIACRVEYARMNWARDWRVYPNMTVRTTVPQDSPAFAAIYDTSRRLYADMHKMEEFFRDCLSRVKLIFMNGEGWPTDVSADGSNLIHTAINKMIWYPESTFVSQDFNLFTKFIASLKEMGVPIDDDSIRGTPLHCLIGVMPFSGYRSFDRPSGTRASMVYHFLHILDTEITTLRGLSHSRLMRILELGNPEVYELIDCNDLSRLILQRCEPGILNLLRSNHSLIDYCTAGGVTALHFAVPWPKGLLLLIDHGGASVQSIINSCGHYISPLDYALRLRKVDSVAVLLDAGASIHPSIFLVLASPVKQDEVFEKMIHVVVESLARQRRDLLRIALQYLPTDIIEELQLRNERLLDDKAFAVVEALRRHHVPIPTTCDFLEPGSVYHWDGLTARIAQKLFEAGFYNISSRLRGYTPLMMQILRSSSLVPNFCVLFQLVSWFKGHGADFHTPVDIPGDISRTHDAVGTGIASYVNPPRPPIHFLMSKLGAALNGQIGYGIWYHLGRFPKYKDLSQIFTANQPILATLFGDEPTDSCVCYCAAHGCTPASKYLIPILEKVTLSGCAPYTASGIKAIRLGELMIPENKKSKVLLEYIRLITHWGLGMRHTCCRLSVCPNLRDGGNLVQVLDTSEVQEIREEERYLAKQLETLVDEFEKKFQDLNIPLSQFMEEYMIPRLEEVRNEQDELSADELYAIRETGVILYED